MENNQLKGINRRLPVLRDQVAEARIHVERSLDHLYRSRAASRSTAPASSSLTAREWTAILNSFSNIEKTLKSLNEEAEPNLEEPLHVRAFVPQLGKKRRFNGEVKKTIRISPEMQHAVASSLSSISETD